VALQVLYATDLGDAGQGAASDVFEGVATHFDLHEGARAFAEELALGVHAHRKQLDECIAAHARNWRVERMAAVDRNILRLAAFELLYTETPTQVVLDEAIELAREFGGERSPAFVNGVLDALARARSETREPGEVSEE
jgi:N utilization substance protein B